MRPSFGDLVGVRTRAKESFKNGLTKLKRWWSNKYKLPTNHPLFENRPIALHEEEYLVDLWETKAEIEAKMESGLIKHNEGSAILDSIYELLGLPQENGDALVDEWEADIARGVVPDLNKKRV